MRAKVGCTLTRQLSNVHRRSSSMRIHANPSAQHPSAQHPPGQSRGPTWSCRTAQETAGAEAPRQRRALASRREAFTRSGAGGSLDTGKPRNGGPPHHPVLSTLDCRLAPFGPRPCPGPVRLCLRNQRIASVPITRAEEYARVAEPKDAMKAMELDRHNGRA
jgi:hypothetical protein